MIDSVELQTKKDNAMQKTWLRYRIIDEESQYFQIIKIIDEIIPLEFQQLNWLGKKFSNFDLDIQISY